MMYDLGDQSPAIERDCYEWWKGRDGEDMPRIREIVLRDRRTEKNYSSLVAMIDDDGDLILEGYDVGEAPKEFWGDSDYEYWRMVKKDYKDTILDWLIKERFDTKLGFNIWLKKKGIPSGKVRKDYKDTTLLWLIKERFDTESDFSIWLKRKGIPSQFDSWV
jgi:hypothetical protein